LKERKTYPTRPSDHSCKIFPYLGKGGKLWDLGRFFPNPQSRKFPCCPASRSPSQKKQQPRIIRRAASQRKRLGLLDGKRPSRLSLANSSGRNFTGGMLSIAPGWALYRLWLYT